MSEEGGKVELPSVPVAEEGVHVEAHEQLNEQLNMEDGQPSQLSVGNEETKSIKKETSEETDKVNEMEAPKEVAASDGNVKVTESKTNTEEVEEGTSEEALPEASPCNPDLADEVKSTLVEESPAATSEEISAPNAEETPTPTSDDSPTVTLESPATPQEDPSTVPQAESSIPENSSAASSEVPQIDTPEDPLSVRSEDPAVDSNKTSDVTTMEPQVLDSTEPSTTSQGGPQTVDVDIASESVIQTPADVAEGASIAQKEGSSEDQVNGVSAGQEASDNHKTDVVKSNPTKPAPPKVLPKPKYEPPEIKVDLFVKAHASFPNKLGDCPFCHRIMMILKLKKIGGTVCPVNLNVKSREFDDFCAKHGLPTKVPIIQHGETVMCDSNSIADYLDKIRPVPKLVCLSKATNAAGDKVFLKFSAFIKNKVKSNDAKLAQALTDELGRLDTFLSTSPGCFLDGDDLQHPDCILLPKLHHVRIAAKHYKKYEIPESLRHVHSYLAAADRHSVFASTKPSDDAVIEGWRKHAI